MELRSTGNPDTSNPVTMSVLEYLAKKGRETMGMTNAQRIRSMTDEELAEYLTTFQNAFGEEYEGMMSCLDWLKQPVED